MRGKTFLVAIVALLVWLISGQAKAVDEAEHVGLFLNGSMEMAEGSKSELTYHFSWMNLTGSLLPYTYLGVKRDFGNHVNLEAMIGYGFEILPENNGLIYALAPTFKFAKLSFYNDLEYRSGLDCLWTAHSLTYQVWKVRPGIDSVNFYYLAEEDETLRAYRVGPSLRLPFSKTATLGVFYFYQFENDGEDSKIFKVILSFNF